MENFVNNISSFLTFYVKIKLAEDMLTLWFAKVNWFDSTRCDELYYIHKDSFMVVSTQSILKSKIWLFALRDLKIIHISLLDTFCIVIFLFDRLRAFAFRQVLLWHLCFCKGERNQTSLSAGNTSVGGNRAVVLDIRLS